MTNIFDLKEKVYENYENRSKNVFFENEQFKTRIIGLKPGQMIPECDMKSFVIFYVLGGTVEITKNHETARLNEGQLLITEPAIISMKTEAGAKLLGIQISKITGVV
ncbi:MAG: hypothetical protein FXF54_02525 [Kosmotoga sp.]|nr:MAG: hypothetical protein FXF54_02525 [Kosmotoga sp.]